jgi:hypothetical protein
MLLVAASKRPLNSRLWNRARSTDNQLVLCRRVLHALTLWSVPGSTWRECRQLLPATTATYIPADRFAAALLMALALREQFSQDRLSSFAKGLRVNVPALCKRLKADKPDEPAS